ncbi:DUF4221 family protein [Roseivirga sp.]|uniref:DUF4221 family protein n=1 Tax=Roseivirga sp. TaxID=1964215 RepID=UPI003B52078C
MKKWYFFLMTFIVVGLISCNKQEEAREYSLKSSDSLLRVKLDSLTSNLSSWLNYRHDEKLDSGMLFSVDPGQNEIELYSLNEGRLLDKVTYEREGPNGVGVLIEIGIQGLDSVLIFPAFDNSFYQSRLSDLALSKVEYEKPDEYAAIRSMTNYFGSNAYTDEDFIYTRTLFGGDYTLLDNEQLSAKPLMYRVNVASGEVEFSRFTFPDDYWADGKRHYEFSSIIDENRFTFSFHSDHHIYYGTSFHEPLKKKPAKSKYLNQELEYLPIAGDRNDRRRYFATAGHYGNLIYDQFRKVYYRFCYPKKQLEPDQDLQQITLFPKEFSVMILNSELEVIGETLIGDDNHLYATSNVFVGPKGLYISVNHPESEMNREDTFGFQLFTLESVLK